jgi:hypothetical protein
MADAVNGAARCARTIVGGGKAGRVAPRAEDAVLASVEDLILNPAVIDRALAVGEDTLRRDRTAERQAAFETELAAVKHAIVRLTEAIATGGDLMPLVKALEMQEQRQKELEARLDAIRRPHHTSDPAAVRRQLLRYLQDWRGFLRAKRTTGATGVASPDHRSSQLHTEREGTMLRVQWDRNGTPAPQQGQYGCWRPRTDLNRRPRA